MHSGEHRPWAEALGLGQPAGFPARPVPSTAGPGAPALPWEGSQSPSPWQLALGPPWEGTGCSARAPTPSLRGDVFNEGSPSGPVVAGPLQRRGPRPEETSRHLQPRAGSPAETQASPTPTSSSCVSQPAGPRAGSQAGGRGTAFGNVPSSQGGAALSSRSQAGPGSAAPSAGTPVLLRGDSRAVPATVGPRGSRGRCRLVGGPRPRHT